MDLSSTQDLIDYWRWQPAPLLPLLHAFHERDGYISEETVQAVAAALRIPLAELYGTVSFYHHFARTPSQSREVPRICNGPVCALRGSDELLAAFAAEGANPMPCAGRCDEPIPMLCGNHVSVGLDRESMVAGPTPLPAPNPGNVQECVFAAIREPERHTLDGYRRTGGYLGLTTAVQKQSRSDVIDLLRESQLAGRGGAGFPTGVKWKAVADAPGDPKTVVCNADEGEPGCFKDRALLDHDPHAVIEGLIIAAYATGARRGFIYLRYEYPQTVEILENAMREAQQAGYLGAAILGTDFDFDLYLRRGAGAYVCGEETSLLNSLEGKHPFPRNRPPYPVTHGYEELPTAVNNVETLAAVAPILRNGAAWYQGLGLGEFAGTKVISLSGDVQRPGNYEVPIGLPLMVLLNDWAGGPLPGRSFQAVTMAGLSGGFLADDDLDVTLDEPALRAKGSFLGAGGIIVFDDSRDMVAAAQGASSFFAHESCGKCFPCRIGTERLSERLEGGGPSDLTEWLQEVEEIGMVMKETSACGLGMAAPLVVESLARYFPQQLETALARDE